jgi:hypothetical protein
MGLSVLKVGSARFPSIIPRPKEPWHYVPDGVVGRNEFSMAKLASQGGCSRVTIVDGNHSALDGPRARGLKKKEKSSTLVAVGGVESRHLGLGTTSFLYASDQIFECHNRDTLFW